MTTAVALIVLALAVLTARFCGLPLRDKLSFVPDDAFYYMKLGGEFARSGRWSFDGGRTTTTGFHLLFGYVSVLVESALRTRTERALDVRLVLHAVMAAALTATAVALLAQVCRRVFPRGALVATLAAGGAGGVFLLPLQAMEWPYAAVAGALLVRALGARRPAWIAAAVVFGCVCRSDFPIGAASLAVAVWSTDPRLAESWARPRMIAIGFGTALGVALTSFHDFRVDGRLLQSSATMKAYWGSVTGYRFGYGLEPASYVFSPAFLLTHVLDCGPATLYPILLVVAGLAWRSRGRSAEAAHEQRALGRFGALAVLAYAAAYGLVGTAAMCWYSASYFAAVFVGVAALAEYASDAARGVGVALGVVLAGVGAWNARLPMWNSGGFLAAGKALREDDAIPVVASWNAGTLGFLGGDKVVNVDGLVNDDVQPYVVRGRLHCYLVHERIPFIVDRADWPTPARAAYLGFADGRLRAAMTPYDLGPGGLAAWRLDLAKLAQDPTCAEDLRPPRSRAARPYP